MTTPARRRGIPAPEHWFGAGYLPTWQVYPSALLAHWRYRGAHRVKRGSVRVGDIDAQLRDERRWEIDVFIDNDGREWMKLKQVCTMRGWGATTADSFLLVAPPPGRAALPVLVGGVGDD